jgi:hypothetical protein
MGFLDDLYRDHGRSVEDQLSTQYGLSREDAARVLPQVAPVILGGLKRRAEQQGQNPKVLEDDLLRILRGGGSHSPASSPSSPPAPQTIDPSVIFGSKRGQAEQVIAGRMGLSPELTAKVLPMLIPVVLGALSKAGNSASPSHASTPSGNSSGPGGSLGGLSTILDQNGDGSIMDDLARMSGGAKSGGCLSALLGGLLGGGKRR